MARVQPESAEVVVVGGGLIGCAIAFELACRGVGVTVFEQNVPARAASWAGAGMLSPIGPALDPGFEAIRRASLAAYPAFLERIIESGSSPVEFATAGTLQSAFDESEAARLHALAKSAGVRALTHDEALRIEPALNPAVSAALHFPDDALVDNRALGEALWYAAERRGVRFRLGEPVLSLVTRGQHVSGVRTSHGTLPARNVVIAAGAWSGQIDGLPRPLPVVPVRGQMIALRHIQQPINGMLHSKGCYLIPRSGCRILVGATVERVGFDPRTTAAGIQSLLAAATQLVPVLDRAEVIDMWTGIRPGTPDDLPVLGTDPSIAGLFHATGHYRNGILLAPITGTLIADLIEGHRPVLPLDDFRADRFE